jgi:hypothetical protein
LLKGSRGSQNQIDQKTALTCIAIVRRHAALNDSERMLLKAIENEIRVAFDLDGAVKPGLLLEDTAGETPELWFW